MVCPSCGKDIPEDLKLCNECGYKFSYWRGFNDPRNMRVLNFITGAPSKKSAITRLIVYAVLVLSFLFMMYSWMQY